MKLIRLRNKWTDTTFGSRGRQEQYYWQYEQLRGVNVTENMFGDKKGKVQVFEGRRSPFPPRPRFFISRPNHASGI